MKRFETFNESKYFHHHRNKIDNGDPAFGYVPHSFWFPKMRTVLLIIGVDNFENLESWKDLSGLLTESNLIVTSRPGFSFPSTPEEMPPTIKNLTEEFDFNFVELKTGRHIQFINLQDVEVSATEIRKYLKIHCIFGMIVE